ncbi:MAG: hypothetical protein HYU60_05855 [Magnetospirillum sp.]|nr:hypothetical protein [Magnetospirillum sp.]
MPLWLAPRIHEKIDSAWVKAGAARESLSHHIDVWREALAADRARPKLDPIGRAELAFLPAALEVSETPAAPAARFIAFTVMGFFVATLAWASVAKLDEVASAQGKVIHVDGTQVIQPLETSRIRSILVKEGDEVALGQTLMELEITGAGADVSRLASDLDAARAASARLAALLEPDPVAAFRPENIPPALLALERNQLDSQWREHQAKLATLAADLSKRRAETRTIAADIDRLTRTEAMILDRTERRRHLAGQGLGSEIERLKAEQELEENRGSGTVQRSKLMETQAAITGLASQARQAREEFRRDVSAKLS